MKTKHISYGKTKQFRQLFQEVSRSFNYVGVDENGDAKYDHSIKKPKILFKFTQKLHGTNAGICFNDNNGLYTQSKNNSFDLTSVDSHMGFTQFVRSNEELFLEVIKQISEDYKIDTSEHTITLYGEWAGSNIQKNVAITNIPKTFFLFAVKISKEDVNFVNYYIDCEKYRFDNERVYNIFEFETYEVEVDFENPSESQNKISEIVDNVENECPVAKHFGFSGIGEGVVGVGHFKGNRLVFKAKGDKHAGKSKVTKFKKVDSVKMNKINKLTDELTPTWRLSQFLNEVTDNEQNFNRKDIGKFIRLVIKDIYEEEFDLITESGLEAKELNPKISKICSNYFFMKENEYMDKK